MGGESEKRRITTTHFFGPETGTSSLIFGTIPYHHKKVATFAQLQLFDAMSKLHDLLIKTKLRTRTNSYNTRKHQKARFSRVLNESP